MRYAITHPIISHPYNPELVSGQGVAEVAAAAEAAGFHGFGFTDHPAPTQRWLEAGGHDALDPFVAMGVRRGADDDASADPEHRGAAVPQPVRGREGGRHARPALRAAGSRSRSASGYLKREFAALGVDFDERNELFDEALEVIRAIWTSDDVTFEGRHFTARGITAHPPPASQPASADLDRRQHGHGPGSGSPRHGDGWCPFPAPAGLASTAGTAAMDTIERLARRHRRPAAPLRRRRSGLVVGSTSASATSPAAARPARLQRRRVPDRPGQAGGDGRDVGAGGRCRVTAWRTRWRRSTVSVSS